MNRRLGAASVGPPTLDVALAAGLLLLGQVEIWLIADVDTLVAAPLMAAEALALAWRRRAPFIVAALIMGLLVATSMLSVPVDDLSTPMPVFVVALYSLGAHARPRRAVVGLAIALAAVTIAVFAHEGPGADNLLFGIVVVSAPWVAGWLVRIRTEQVVELALRAQELEHSQGEREQSAVAEERARIARELHDIVAHSVSVMTIQAGAIQEVLDKEPEKAREAAESIRQTGRQALVDLRRLLGLLREEQPSSGVTGPQPGLSQLDELLDKVRGAGIDVRLEIEGAPRSLPPALDLSAFRVVQEALTNTLKHARASAAVVGIRYAPDVVTIDVADDGVGGNGSGTGHGLIGMRERIALYGGELEFGGEARGGFRVHARLPVDGEAM